MKGAKRCGKECEGLKIMLVWEYSLPTFVYSSWVVLDIIWISSLLMGDNKVKMYFTQMKRKIQKTGSENMAQG